MDPLFKKKVYEHLYQIDESLAATYLTKVGVINILDDLEKEILKCPYHSQTFTENQMESKLQRDIEISSLSSDSDATIDDEEAIGNLTCINSTPFNLSMTRVEPAFCTTKFRLGERKTEKPLTRKDELVSVRPLEERKMKKVVTWKNELVSVRCIPISAERKRFLFTAAHSSEENPSKLMKLTGNIDSVENLQESTSNEAKKRIDKLTNVIENCFEPVRNTFEKYRMQHPTSTCNNKHTTKQLEAKHLGETSVVEGTEADQPLDLSIQTRIYDEDRSENQSLNALTEETKKSNEKAPGTLNFPYGTVNQQPLSMANAIKSKNNKRKSVIHLTQTSNSALNNIQLNRRLHRKSLHSIRLAAIGSRGKLPMS